MDSKEQKIERLFDKLISNLPFGNICDYIMIARKKYMDGEKDVCINNVSDMYLLEQSGISDDNYKNIVELESLLA